VDQSPCIDRTSSRGVSNGRGGTDRYPRITKNPVITAHFARKRAAGKSNMTAVGHCMSKAISIDCSVWRNSADLDPTGARGLDKNL